MPSHRSERGQGTGPGLVPVQNNLWDQYTGDQLIALAPNEAVVITNLTAMGAAVIRPHVNIELRSPAPSDRVRADGNRIGGNFSPCAAFCGEFALPPAGRQLRIVRAPTRQGSVAQVGDGINDAPALTPATVGIAVGPHRRST
jgi:hypothetical protein